MKHYFSETQLDIERQIENAEKDDLEAERENIFEEIFRSKSDFFFQFKGFKILKFTHKKIKFMFNPSKLVKYVSRRVAFFCSLKFLEEYGSWIVKKDSFPANLKREIYSKFYDGNYFMVNDTMLSDLLQKIYDCLKMWAKRENAFRVDKFTVRYLFIP